MFLPMKKTEKTPNLLFIKRDRIKKPYSRVRLLFYIEHLREMWYNIKKSYRPINLKFMEKCIMDIGRKNEWLNMIMDNDNEIGKIYRDNYEYVIEINMWNGDIRILKTVNCRKIVHNVELVDEIGDITFNDKVYKFLTVDDSDAGPETILEIVADDIILIK